MSSSVIATPPAPSSSPTFRAGWTPPRLITTQIEAWRTKVFVQTDRITRSSGSAEQLICEGRETRAFVKRDEADPDRLRAIPVPEDIRLLCS